MPLPRTPAVTTDIIIELHDRPERPIVLIERRNPPLGWALPGGFVDVGESVERAAIREAAEETSLDVRLLQLLGCYSDPGRDSRGHSITLVYIAVASGEPRAQDDAKNLALFDPRSLPTPLTFDHGRILEDYREWRELGRLPVPRLRG